MLVVELRHVELVGAAGSMGARAWTGAERRKEKKGEGGRKEKGKKEKREKERKRDREGDGGNRGDDHGRAPTRGIRAKREMGQ